MKTVDLDHDPQIQLVGDWRLIYDYQQTDDWFKKSATIIILEGDAQTNFDNKIYKDFLHHAIVVNDKTDEQSSKTFFGESSHNDSMRWASDLSNKIVYGND